jgi:hypothetical protein
MLLNWTKELCTYQPISKRGNIGTCYLTSHTWKKGNFLSEITVEEPAKELQLLFFYSAEESASTKLKTSWRNLQ